MSNLTSSSAPASATAPRPRLASDIPQEAVLPEVAPVSPGYPAKIEELQLPDFWPEGLDPMDNQRVSQWLLGNGEWLGQEPGWKHYALDPATAAMKPGTWAWRNKRAMDLTLTLLGLSFALPIMGLAALALKISSPRDPVLFKQWRPGYLCKPFQILKFRTMRVDGHPLTRLGRFLRITSLDELPQLFNVLKGEMSLVGPRPLQVKDFRPAMATASVRQGCPPGITGLAQVDYGSAATLAERCNADLEFLEDCSLLQGIGILARTPFAVLRTIFAGGANQSVLLSAIRALGRRQKQGLLLLTDTSLTFAAMFLAFGLRQGAWPQSAETFLWMGSAVLCVRIPVFAWFGLYRLKLSAKGQDFSKSIILGALISSCAVFFPLLISQAVNTPRLVFLIEAPLAAILIIGSRETFASLIYSRRCRNRLRKPVLLYGAGNVGTQLALSLQADEDHEFRPVAFLDDDASKQGLKICGLEVLAPNSARAFAMRNRVDTILLTIPSLKGWERAPLIERFQNDGFQVQTVPSLIDIVSGKNAVDDIRVITADDLLCRDSVSPIPELLSADVRNKVVCVTGAGGSIGSELCRQISVCAPEALVLFEQSEHNLYEIEMELGRRFPELKLAAILGSVCDRKRMDSVLQGYCVETLYHSAAYKHVPMVEQNPIEGARNNVLGTLTAAEAAAAAGVAKFVLISTDKAVRPTNVMGATKRIAEEVCALVARKTSSNTDKTVFGVVRFGNVLDSTGSVVPLFRSQISRGEDLTVTHPEVTRYFMTIQEAAQLVMQAGAQATSDEVFLLDMGEPIKVMDLAERMIRLHTHSNGSTPVKIQITGLRPGEKLYEEMFLDKNKAEPTLHQKIWRAVESFKENKEADGLISDIKQSVENEDIMLLNETLRTYVEGFAPQKEAEDLADKASFGTSFAGNHDTSLSSAPTMPLQQ